MKTSLGDSTYTQYIGKSVKWFATDSEEAYVNNLKIRRHKLEEYGFIDAEITYTFNQYGFRSEEFVDDADSIVFLGASDTVGVGLALEDTWTYQVASALNLRHYNLSIGGLAGDGAFRLAYHWLEKLKPKVVVLMSPKNVRLEAIDDRTEQRWYWQLSPFLKKSSSNGNNNSYRRKETVDDLDRFYKIWTSSEDNFILNQAKNEMATERLTENINAKFVKCDSNRDWWTSPITGTPLDMARDLEHAGKKSNLAITDLVLSKI